MAYSGYRFPHAVGCRIWDVIPVTHCTIPIRRSSQPSTDLKFHCHATWCSSSNNDSCRDASSGSKNPRTPAKDSQPAQYCQTLPFQSQKRYSCFLRQRPAGIVCRWNCNLPEASQALSFANQDMLCGGGFVLGTRGEDSMHLAQSSVVSYSCRVLLARLDMQLGSTAYQSQFLALPL